MTDNNNHETRSAERAERAHADRVMDRDSCSSPLRPVCVEPRSSAEGDRCIQSVLDLVLGNLKATRSHHMITVAYYCLRNASLPRPSPIPRWTGRDEIVLLALLL